MKTLTHRFNQAVKQLKQGLDFTDCEIDPTMVIKILEPSYNMDFVTIVTKITKDGKIYSKQFEDCIEKDWFCSDISDLMNRESKEKVCELVEDSVMNTDIKALLELYNKRYIKIATESDFMFQLIYPLYRYIGKYYYPVNIKSWGFKQ